MENWLSLTISGKDTLEKGSAKASFFIAVPKKVVRLAVQRNRIKRLIREAVRSDGFFEKKNIYRFKVRKFPVILDLYVVQKAVNELKVENE